MRQKITSEPWTDLESSENNNKRGLEKLRLILDSAWAVKCSVSQQQSSFFFFPEQFGRRNKWCLCSFKDHRRSKRKIPSLKNVIKTRAVMKISIVHIVEKPPNIALKWSQKQKRCWDFTSTSLCLDEEHRDEARNKDPERATQTKQTWGRRHLKW